MPVSSLWTPGGEVPVERDAGPPTEADLEGQAAELQRFLLEAPAEQIVAEHAMGLYELAVLHLSQAEPRLADARLAIDALAALVDGLQGRLGDLGTQLRAALPQLQMAFVQLADRGTAPDPSTEGAEG